MSDMFKHSLEFYAVSQRFMTSQHHMMKTSDKLSLISRLIVVHTILIIPYFVTTLKGKKKKEK